MPATSMDPYKVLSLDKNFTLDQLKRRYRELAIQLHPDRQTPNAKAMAQGMFEIVRGCYEQLLFDYKARMSDKQHADLKTAFQIHEGMPSAQARTAQAQTAPPVTASGQKFDVNRFNKLFEENRLPDAYHGQGYDEWMRKHDPDANPQALRRACGAIVHYKDPEPMLTGVAAGPFYQLGVDKVSDFSGSDYMDYRLAHTTTKLVDERAAAAAGRKDYRSVEDLKHERASMSNTPDPAYLARLAKEEHDAKVAEERRQQALLRQDSAWAQHFERVNRLLLNRH